MTGEDELERTGDWSENPERGPNAAVAKEFEEGAYREGEEEQGEQAFRSADPELETDWEREFLKQVEEDASEPDRVVDDDNYQLVREELTEDVIDTQYVFNPPANTGDAPFITMIDAESVENILSAAYQDFDIEANYGDEGLEISVTYDEHDSLFEGASRVMDVYRTFDEVLEADSPEDFQTM